MTDAGNRICKVHGGWFTPGPGQSQFICEDSLKARVLGTGNCIHGVAIVKTGGCEQCKAIHGGNIYMRCLPKIPPAKRGPKKMNEIEKLEARKAREARKAAEGRRVGKKRRRVQPA